MDVTKIFTYMIFPGEDKKYKITCTQQDFSLYEDSFEVVVKDQYGRVVQSIRKGDCFWDDDGNCYFVMENVRKGVYYAFFTGSYEDEDFSDGQRTFKDVQELMRAGYKGGATCHRACGHVVQYEEVWTVSIDGEDYLCDKDGRYILTADGKRICFKTDKPQMLDSMGKVRLETMTGDEFKQLIEGRSMDGKTNTIPEMIDVLQGINNEETTIKDDVDQQIDTGVEQRKASESDIDEIFNKQS